MSPGLSTCNLFDFHWYFEVSIFVNLLKAELQNYNKKKIVHVPPQLALQPLQNIQPLQNNFFVNIIFVSSGADLAISYFFCGSLRLFA